MIIAQWDQISEPGHIGALAIVVIIVTTVVSVLSCCYLFLKLMPELKAIQAEVVSKSAQTLLLLHEKRDAYSDSVDAFTLKVTALVRAIESNNIADLDTLREACCMELTGNVFQCHFKQIDFERLYYENNTGDMLDFIQDDLFTDLDRFTYWLRVLNHEKLLAKIDGTRHPLQISRNTAKPWYRIVNALPQHLQQDVKEDLWDNHLQPLLDVGQPKDNSE